jgi:prolyl oligopeptidase PreP (S9A serine peptidase family)
MWTLGTLSLGIIQAIVGILRHRRAISNWMTAGTKVQQLLARHASLLGGDLPKQVATGEVVAVSASDVDEQLFVSATSFLVPTTLWLADAASGKTEAVKASPARFDAQGLITEQREAISKVR